MKQIFLKVLKDGTTTSNVSSLIFDGENLTTKVSIDYSGVGFSDWIKQADIFVGQTRETDYEYTNEVGNVLEFYLEEGHLVKGYLRIQPLVKRLEEGSIYSKQKWETVELKVKKSLNVLEDDISITQSIAEQWEIRIQAVEDEEVIRQSNEDTRIANENTRIENEDERILNEQGRVSAESTRVSQENARNVFVSYNGSTAYVVGNKVSYNGSSYVCILNSTGNLPTNSTYWLLIASKGDNTTASAVTNTPSGNISATTVQDAINELNTVKADRALQEIVAKKINVVSPVLVTYKGDTPTNSAIISTFRGWARQVNYSGQVFNALSILVRTEIANVDITLTIRKHDRTTILATGYAKSTGNQSWINFILDKELNSTLITETGFYVFIEAKFGTGCRLRADIYREDGLNHDNSYTDFYITTYTQVDWSNIGNSNYPMAIKFANTSTFSLISATLETDIFNQLSLPPKVYSVENKELNIYYDSLVKRRYQEDLIEVKSDLGYAQDERWTNKSTVFNGYSITFNRFSQTRDLLASGSTLLVMAQASAKSGENPKCLFIGDSLTDGGTYTGELINLMNSDVMDITLIGTKGTAPNKHEGSGGWTLSKFYSDVTSPFVFSGSFNFSQYMTTNSFTGVDYVFFCLGINDIFWLADVNAVDTLWATMKTQYEAIFTSIKSFNPSVKIGIMTPPPPSNHQDAFGKNYFSGATQWKYKEKWHKLICNMIDYFKNREAESIYIVPTHVNIDTERNMQTESVAANSRNATLITRQSNGVHPAASGYYQMADSVYYFIKNV